MGCASERVTQDDVGVHRKSVLAPVPVPVCARAAAAVFENRGAERTTRPRSRFEWDVRERQRAAQVLAACLLVCHHHCGCGKGPPHNLSLVGAKVWSRVLTVAENTAESEKWRCDSCKLFLGALGMQISCGAHGFL